MGLERRGRFEALVAIEALFEVPVGLDGLGVAGDMGITKGALSLTNSGEKLTNAQVKPPPLGFEAILELEPIKRRDF